MISRDAAQKRGRQNKALGDQCESWVDGQHEMAAQLGILAHVEKTQARTKVINGKLIFEKPGIADYIGCLESTQRIPAVDGIGCFEPHLPYKVPAQYFACEAKSTDEHYLPRARIEPRQQAHLNAVAKAGGLALLVVEFRSTVAPFFARYAVPWLSVPWVVLKTAESVQQKDIEEWIVPPGTCYLSHWHSGGPRSSVGTTATGSRQRVYSAE